MAKIAVMGAGAVGCYYGALLAQAGELVTLIGRPALVQAVEPRLQLHHVDAGTGGGLLIQRDPALHAVGGEVLAVVRADGAGAARGAAAFRAGGRSLHAAGGALMQLFKGVRHDGSVLARSVRGVNQASNLKRT